jgi:hypothetical protein
MCGICGSDNLEVFKELVAQNIERGNFSHSYTVVDLSTKKVVQQIKSFQTKSDWYFHLLELEAGHNLYYLGHTQAPTGGLVQDFFRIHPSTINYQVTTQTYLAHNGVLTDAWLASKNFNINDSYWDTHVLHHLLRSSGIRALDDVKGSFACWYIDEFGSIKIFRNPQAPLYLQGFNRIYKGMPTTHSLGTFSSSFFEGSKMIDHGVVFELKIDKGFGPIETFKTHNVYGL